MFNTQRFGTFHPNLVIVPKPPRTRLKRFISRDEQVQLSQVVFQLMIEESAFPMLPGNLTLSKQLREINIDPCIANWLLSQGYESAQDIAKCIAEHNDSLIHYLIN